ncbi:3-hydroxyacyl-CoA dehydrogenase [Umezawaea sp. Da 62-37]|uniref:3-hydroxyacyl-CoA dehydrogenase n=1 Tax=Umezawaea sp. Da 62-37 TaxID=3075927 RepID=UPI0028F6F140|nr:3-hydroxyacyl-CoA dehydrogenase [Umezawaea sp. Da 62-37]WNV85636.1 3-hydroxyacyl-CoA dehydrogenase [Umezawaea sp. Da 62-37]
MTAVVGAGSIGVAWAVVFARAGHPVALFDISPDRLSAATGELRSAVDELHRHGLLAEDPDSLLARVRVASSLADAVSSATHVQECVAESLPVKQELFARLDELAPPDAVLASSTSMIPCSRFAADLPGRARCLVVHPGNPPYLLPIAELVPAPFTDPAVVETTRVLLAEAGMTPVVLAKEVEGFVFNRLQGAVLREAYTLVRDGVMTPADVDLVVSHGLGRRWSVLGPFSTADLNTRGGLERHAEVMGPAYARMAGENAPWTPELVRSVADTVHATLPPERWEDNVRRRDHALMLLEAARRTAPELFTPEP